MCAWAARLHKANIRMVTTSRDRGSVIIYTKEVLRAEGTKAWRKDGEIHRLDGPAIISQHGVEIWHSFGSRRRANGPAVVARDGTEYWYQNGKYRRIDGPAIIFPDGREYSVT